MRLLATSVMVGHCEIVSSACVSVAGCCGEGQRTAGHGPAHSTALSREDDTVWHLPHGLWLGKRTG